MRMTSRLLTLGGVFAVLLVIPDAIEHFADRLQTLPVHTAAGVPSVVPPKCHFHGSGLTVTPDRRKGCTPGQWINDPDLSAAHVCDDGSYNPRPGTSVTEPLKHATERLYGETSVIDRTIEADHYFPLWLGGATTLANFWPEPNYAHARGFDHNPKDKLEFAIYKLVCEGKRSMTVAQARTIFETVPWPAAYKRYVGSS